jgi:hypothetical protein
MKREGDDGRQRVRHFPLSDVLFLANAEHVRMLPAFVQEDARSSSTKICRSLDVGVTTTVFYSYTSCRNIVEYR